MIQGVTTFLKNISEIRSVIVIDFPNNKYRRLNKMEKTIKETGNNQIHTYLYGIRLLSIIKIETKVQIIMIGTNNKIL